MFIVLDTETTSLDKPFCYDLGYVVVDETTFQIVMERHFVIEQIWHNLPLFESAYYKEKRQLYVRLLRTRQATLEKWGYATATLRRDIKRYGVTDVYAYNSDFDDKVMAFNCDWFKTINPIEDVPIHDIWGYASEFITNTNEYRAFCKQYERFTDTGNYKGSAEVVYQFLTNSPDFVEAHMGLMDSQIEADILIACVRNYNAELGEDYRVARVLPALKFHPFKVQIDGTPIYEGEYVKKIVRKGNYNFITKM